MEFLKKLNWKITSLIAAFALWVLLYLIPSIKTMEGSVLDILSMSMQTLVWLVLGLVIYLKTRT